MGEDESQAKSSALATSEKKSAKCKECGASKVGGPTSR